MLVTVVSTRSSADLAAATVRSVEPFVAGLDAEVHVLDADGTYTARGGETVTPGAATGLPLGRLALTHDGDALRAALTAWWAADAMERHGGPVWALAPGTVVVGAPDRLLTDPVQSVAITRTADAGPGSVEHPSTMSTDLFLLGTSAVTAAPVLKRLAEAWRSATRCLDLFLVRVPHRILADDAVLVSRWNSDATTLLTAGDDGSLDRDGHRVVALDLAGFDARHPWLFDTRDPESTGPLLSRSPALAAEVRSAVPASRPGGTGGAAATVPARTDAPLVRAVARTAADTGEDLSRAITDADGWLLDLVPGGDRAPAARYLTGARQERRDLREAFPFVPGRDSARLARWALDHGRHENGYDAALLSRAAEVTLAAQPAPEPADSVRPRGINLVGYLSGQLGVGTSARLMDQALAAAGVPTSTFAVTRELQSRAGADYRRTDPVRFDTTLVAVNADQTPAVVGALDDVVAGTYRIGMWYWEVEAFPADRVPAFAHVDEVWAATDFVRDALAVASPVPVRTVMPPLPQRAAQQPPPLPTRLPVPADRPWFFFAFDFLSTAERKNPWGLIEAFTRAFAPDEGPVLVIKTINARRRLADAERLRLQVADRPDVVVIDDYLEQDELTALMARCTAYVSLHRAEGLGLTIAEAMAWGRPVVTSAYSGNMQFTNSGNAYLVPCTPTPIPADAPPYPAGTPWGAPDLDVAAAHLRRIVEDPAEAAARGRQAAHDIRTLHSPEAAGRGVRAVLDEIWQAVDAERDPDVVPAPERHGIGERLARRLRHRAT